MQKADWRGPPGNAGISGCPGKTLADVDQGVYDDLMRVNAAWPDAIERPIKAALRNGGGSGYLTINTGHLECVRTFCATLPRITPARPRRPWDAMTTRSHFSFFAVLRISS